MKYQIVAIGEVLWDLLPEGKQLGGAPANFICHAHALGGDARLVTRVGDDALGREVLEHFKQLGLSTDSVQVDPSAPTGTVSVELGSAGKPSYVIHEKRCLGPSRGGRDRAGCCARGRRRVFRHACPAPGTIATCHPHIGRGSASERLANPGPEPPLALD